MEGDRGLRLQRQGTHRGQGQGGQEEGQEEREEEGQEVEEVQEEVQEGQGRHKFIIIVRFGLLVFIVVLIILLVLLRLRQEKEAVGGLHPQGSVGRDKEAGVKYFKDKAGSWNACNKPPKTPCRICRGFHWWWEGPEHGCGQK